MSNKQPNILFAFADDWGDTPVSTVRWKGIKPQCSFRGPNFDRITNDGALFTNAFVPASSCTPCRSSPSKLLASRSKLLPLSDENLQTNRHLCPASHS